MRSRLSKRFPGVDFRSLTEGLRSVEKQFGVPGVGAAHAIVSRCEEAGIAGSSVLPAARMLEKAEQSAVFTGNMTATARGAMTKHGLSADFIVGRDSVRPPKPSPDGLRQIMWEAGVKPSETLYVGNMPCDAEIGRACEVETILV